jgi:hypothetical protein
VKSTGPDLQLVVAKVQDSEGNWGVQFTFNFGMVGCGLQLNPANARALGQNLIKAADAAEKSIVTPPKHVTQPS